MLTLIFGVTATQAQKINLEVFASKFDSIPIAVTKFSNLGGGTFSKDEPWRVIASDLDFTGKFMVTKAEAADSALFQQKGVPLFVDGEYRITGSSVTLDCYLKDASSMDQIAGKKYQGDLSTVRTLAHKFCNELMQLLFNEKGPFQTQIAYVRTTGPAKNLWLMDFDGSNLRQVTNTKVLNIQPAFADPSTLFWVSYLRGKPDIYRFSLATGKSDIFEYGRYVSQSPSVSLVEGKLAFACSRDGNMEIYSCNLDKSGLKRLTNSRSIDTAPAWSPNGYEVAFVSDRTGTPQIYIMDKEGANVRRITYQGNWQDSPTWSPKGDRIAYSSLNDGGFNIWSVGVDGKDAKKVTEIPGANQNPSWSPDGSNIAFVNHAGGRTDVYAVRPDGSGIKRLTTTGDADTPDWSGFAE